MHFYAILDRLSEPGIDIAVGAFVVEDQNDCHMLPPASFGLLVQPLLGIC
jgi:hypothetical protein